LAVVWAGRCLAAACRSRSRPLALLSFCAVRRSVGSSAGSAPSPGQSLSRVGLLGPVTARYMWVGLLGRTLVNPAVRWRAATCVAVVPGFVVSRGGGAWCHGYRLSTSVSTVGHGIADQDDDRYQATVGPGLQGPSSDRCWFYSSLRCNAGLHLVARLASPRAASSSAGGRMHGTCIVPFAPT